VTTTKPEPRFDIDFAYGRQGELQIGDFLQWVANGDARVEVKRKRYLDHKLYVETACDRGRTGCFEPSGITVTTAEVWVFCIGRHCGRLTPSTRSSSAPMRSASPPWRRCGTSA